MSALLAIPNSPPPILNRVPPSWTTQDVNLTAIQERLQRLRTLGSGPVSELAKARPVPAVPSAPSEQLQLKLLHLKQLTSSVVVYLPKGWRERLFSRLDQILSPEDWDEDNKLPSDGSFSTLLRLMIFLNPTKFPAIGLSSQGTFATAWKRMDARLVVECIGTDEVRWIVSQSTAGRHESAAFKGPLHRILDLTAPFEPEQIYNGA